MSAQFFATKVHNNLEKQRLSMSIPTSIEPPENVLTGTKPWKLPASVASPDMTPQNALKVLPTAMGTQEYI